MQSASSTSIVPVFIFPNAVNFYLGDQKTYKQVLTIYNVYDCVVRFRVLSTAPDKYTVVDPTGSIKPHCSLDIVIRHNDVKPANCNVCDKFRIQLLEATTKKVLGIKDIYATLNSGIPENNGKEEKNETEKSSVEKPMFREISSDDHIGKCNKGPSLFLISMVAVCVAGLLMPNEGDQNTVISIQLSCHMKLVLSYVLGLLTIVILQTVQS